MSEARQTIDFDHHSTEFAQSYTETYSTFRESCPVGWSPHHGGFWAVFSHEVGSNVFRDWESFSNAKFLDANGEVRGGIVIPPNPSLNLIPDEVDPPEWHGYRRLLNRPFAPSAVDEIRSRIVDLATGIIDDLIESGEADLVLDVANPIPAIVTLDILGLPLEDLEIYAPPFHEIVYAPAGSDIRRRAEAGFAKMYEHLLTMIAARRRERSDDFISTLIDSSVDDVPLDDDQIARIVMQILGGGIDTTTALLGSVFMYLEDHPELRPTLANDAALLATATEEFMRYFSPIQAICRSARSDVNVADQPMKEGEPVLISIGSMNRDPAVFDRADEVVLDRMPNRHAGFGVGIHRCLGSNLARAMFQVILVEVLRRMPDYKIDRDRTEKYAVVSAVAGWITMPCTFTPGQRVAS